MVRIIVNEGEGGRPTELTAVATISLNGPGGGVLQRLLHHVRLGLEKGRDA